MTQEADAAASPCSRCAAQLGRSCCEAAEGEALATLTRADVERIQALLHLARSRFVEEEVFAEAQARAYEQLRPGWRGYFRQSTVRLTLARSHGACVFFAKGTGCTLPVHTRPTACLLYPFEPGEDGGWTLAVEREGSVARAQASGLPRCLAVEEADSRKALLDSFHTRPAALRRLAQRLRSEVRAHGQGRGS